MSKPNDSKGAFPSLRCPHCGEQELGVVLRDLTVTCQSCGDEITREQVNDLAQEWQRLLRWLDLSGGA